MMIKSEQEISIMAEAGKKLKFVLTELRKAVKPGITTLDLNTLAERLIIEQGAKVSFKGYQGYPFTLCTSVNEEVVHTFPSDRILEEGDIISLDLGLIWQGWQSDSAITVGVGKIAEEAERLLRITEESLWKGIAQVKRSASSAIFPTPTVIAESDCQPCQISPRSKLIISPSSKILSLGKVCTTS